MEEENVQNQRSENEHVHEMFTMCMKRRNETHEFRTFSEQEEESMIIQATLSLSFIHKLVVDEGSFMIRDKNTQ